MSMQREHMWSAYLDGELSTSEAAEFDETLTPEEKERLQAEVRFEGALGEFLSRGGACPDDVWQGTKKAMTTKGGQLPWWMPTRQAAVFALAAALLMTFAGFLYHASVTTPPFLSMDERFYTDIKLKLNPDDLSGVNDFLHHHGVALVLNAPDGVRRGHGDRRDLLGAYEEMYKGERVTEVLYECCGKPIKLVIAPKAGPAADAMRKAIERGTVQDHRTIGDYVAVTIGNHPARGLLDLLSENQEDVLHRV